MPAASNIPQPPPSFAAQLDLAIDSLQRLRDAGNYSAALYALAHMWAHGPAPMRQAIADDVPGLLLAHGADDPGACYGILNNRIQWLRDKRLQLQHVGQTLDYLAMALGDFSPLTGAQVQTCPSCGRPAVPDQVSPGLTQWIHSELITSWLTSARTDSCFCIDPSQVDPGTTVHIPG